MIVVLDTNVWVSGILWKGPPHDVIIHAERGDFSIATSMPLLDELFTVLSREKFTQHIESAGVDIASIRSAVVALAELWAIDQKITAITTDPDDNAVLECALAADAECIVSGDDHLLSLKSFRDIPIVTPHEFLRILKNE
jgi:putative PIN family toxin of toxin-antitoxin system